MRKQKGLQNNCGRMLLTFVIIDSRKEAVEANWLPQQATVVSC